MEGKNVKWKSNFGKKACRNGTATDNLAAEEIVSMLTLEEA